MLGRLASALLLEPDTAHREGHRNSGQLKAILQPTIPPAAHQPESRFKAKSSASKVLELLVGLLVILLL